MQAPFQESGDALARLVPAAEPGKDDLAARFRTAAAALPGSLTLTTGPEWPS